MTEKELLACIYYCFSKELPKDTEYFEDTAINGGRCLIVKTDDKSFVVQVDEI